MKNTITRARARVGSGDRGGGRKGNSAGGTKRKIIFKSITK